MQFLTHKSIFTFHFFVSVCKTKESSTREGSKLRVTSYLIEPLFTVTALPFLSQTSLLVMKGVLRSGTWKKQRKKLKSSLERKLE